MVYQSLAQMFVLQAERYRDQVLYRFVKAGCWESYTWQRALAEVRLIALGLVSLGVRKGDRVAIFSVNRVEWSLIDWASISVGAVTVPLYSSTSPTEVARLLEHSGATTFFVDSASRWAKLDVAHPSLRAVRNVIFIDQPAEVPAAGSERDCLPLDVLRERGLGYGEYGKELFDHRVALLHPDDDLTIIYTSGTTGEPKGVLTTHRHYLFITESAAVVIPSEGQEITLQFLPFAHSFGRLEHFMAVAQGYQCAFARSMETVASDLRVVRPTLLFSVPRIYENAHRRIQAKVAGTSWWRRLLFRWAFSVGKRWSGCQREGRDIPVGLRVAHGVARRLVFQQIHESFGGRLRVAISGGAPLAPEIAEFFHSVGILIQEGYGLTETSTVSHVNRVERYKFGTVGLPLRGVECRIADDGEILLSGPTIFKGYYGDPVATAEALTPDGWFRTGDVGEIDSDGFLRITDRKKNLIVTSGGKKVAPQVIENLLKTDPLIHEVVILGDKNSHLLALITLNQEELQAWSKRQGIQWDGPEAAASHPQVSARIQKSIRELNRGRAPFEAVRNFRILPQDFTLSAGELTPTLKLRRQVVMERYGDLIEEMTRKPSRNL